MGACLIANGENNIINKCQQFHNPKNKKINKDKNSTYIILGKLKLKQKRTALHTINSHLDNAISPVAFQALSQQ